MVGSRSKGLRVCNHSQRSPTEETVGRVFHQSHLSVVHCCLFQANKKNAHSILCGQVVLFLHVVESQRDLPNDEADFLGPPGSSRRTMDLSVASRCRAIRCPLVVSWGSRRTKEAALVCNPWNSRDRLSSSSFSSGWGRAIAHSSRP